MRRAHLALLLFAFNSALAQQTQQSPQHESELAADFRGEHGRFDQSCLGKSDDPSASGLSASFGGCAELLLTDEPLHITAGSIVPQNGFGAGPALVLHHDAAKWLFKWDIDAVGSVNASWRAGAYMTIVPTGMLEPAKGITVTVSDSSNRPTPQPHKSNIRIVNAPLITVYSQAISLNKIGFFGLGPESSVANRSFFGMTQTIVGARAVFSLPWTKGFNASIVGESNGRFVDIRGDHGEASPSIEAAFNPVTAPGLATQPGFLQFGEGLRLKPNLFHGRLRLNYLGEFQQFIAPADSVFSFRRFTADLSHQIPLTHLQKTKSDDRNGPDECATGATGTLKCPPLRSVSNNRYGTITLRALLSESVASGGSAVPFYFQPTLGGSDVNGSPALSSYQDYRFRGPDLMLFHGDIEHSIPGLDSLKYPVPIGAFFAADSGKVALSRGDLGFHNLRHSFSAGLTVRAGGFPAVFLGYAWAGREGNHTTATVDTSLLGGSPRPSLY